MNQQQYSILDEEGHLSNGLLQQLYFSHAEGALTEAQALTGNDGAWQERKMVHHMKPQCMPAHGAIDPRAIFGPFNANGEQYTPTAHHSALELYSAIGPEQQVGARPHVHTTPLINIVRPPINLYTVPLNLRHRCCGHAVLHWSTFSVKPNSHTPKAERIVYMNVRQTA
jgi:hypothetical protein